MAGALKLLACFGIGPVAENGTSVAPLSDTALRVQARRHVPSIAIIWTGTELSNVTRHPDAMPERRITGLS